MHTYQKSTSGGIGGDVKYTELDTSFDNYGNGESSSLKLAFEIQKFLWVLMYLAFSL